MDGVTADVNRRFREELVRHDIGSESQAARRAGVAQQWLSRRLIGATSWTVVDLEAVCEKLGISYAYVATGMREDDAPLDELLDFFAEYLAARRGQSHLATPVSEPRRST